MVSLHVPRFLLSVDVTHVPGTSRWRFALRQPDGKIWLQAGDDEPCVSAERLELLSVVRALEALDQPSEVTLVSRSPYIVRGLRFGIPQWRASNWQWERFGVLVSIKDDDLWRRFDHALRFHSFKVRAWRLDTAHAALRGPTRRRRTADGGRPAWHSAPTASLRELPAANLVVSGNVR